MAAPAIRVRGLVKRFGALTAVDGIDLEVQAGECFGLLGPNGAGKTTTMEILEGLQPADGGTVEVLGLRWDREPEALRERIGVQLQETQLYLKASVAETLQLFRSFYRRPAPLDEVIAGVDLQEKRDAWVGKLSGGQRQRLAIACALVSQPDLLFLDEPTTGLDPTSRRQLWDLLARLRAGGRTQLLTTHYMEEAERLCDRVAIVDRGRILALGTPADLIATVGGERIVEVASDPPLTAAQVESVPGLVEVRPAEGGALHLVVRDVRAALPAVMDGASRAAVALRHVITRQPTLEDVFLHLTGHGLGNNHTAAQ